jgi:hypothetical protein
MAKAETKQVHHKDLSERRLVIRAVPKSRMNSPATEDQHPTFEMKPLTDEDKNRAGERYGKWPNCYPKYGLFAVHGLN